MPFEVPLGALPERVTTLSTGDLRAAGNAFKGRRPPPILGSGLIPMRRRADQASARALRRRNDVPANPRPRIIIDQVAGSGTEMTTPIALPLRSR
jgi:hypothetical protein